jgi:hypothetical protein
MIGGSGLVERAIRVTCRPSNGLKSLIRNLPPGIRVPFVPRGGILTAADVSGITLAQTGARGEIFRLRDSRSRNGLVNQRVQTIRLVVLFSAPDEKEKLS